MALPLFNRTLDSFGERLALKSDTESISYLNLQNKVKDRIRTWQSHSVTSRPLILLRMANSIESVVNYLACLYAHYPCILINQSAPEEVINSIRNDFSPNFIVVERDCRVSSLTQHTLAEDLALLLSTSGSTGSKKFVALSYKNLIANTQSILGYLPIEQSDTTLGSLPLSYSYGLSILHTHLAVGACIRFTELTVMEKGFWEVLEHEKISSLNGVPSWYEMLLRLRFEQKTLPKLRYLTQAGGKLNKQLVLKLAGYAKNNNKQFYVMYGQTEATARIAYLSPKKLHVKPNSIGKAISGGELTLYDDKNAKISQPQKEGELVYRGPNIMLGYVDSAKELGKFFPQESLPTGDLGYFDEDGDFFITGRLKRMIKLFGERCSLDEIEARLNSAGFPVRCIGEDNLLAICTLSDSEKEIKQYAIKMLRTSPKAIITYRCEQWPLLENGKIDYTALQRQVLAKV
ncbi:AMP-binding protein [Alteromonas sp. ASW11-130]|uniref:AMP-binding protein n=1 Tax=Alteromonas sp. ASW11-130 TaxID=3015775 RepID=UPI002241B1CB|nr:AMP-binding protein [Alteromonas sp. ASW11-130]MCW8090338.1 AMP-binding protein [Alteromonas sp. ASW11-130]